MHMEFTRQCFVKWVTGMCGHLGAWWSVSTSEGYWGARIQRLSSNGFQQLLQRDGIVENVKDTF